jgi:hypothetical protein
VDGSEIILRTPVSCCARKACGCPGKSAKAKPESTDALSAQLQSGTRTALTGTSGVNDQRAVNFASLLCNFMSAC